MGLETEAAAPCSPASPARVVRPFQAILDFSRPVEYADAFVLGFDDGPGRSLEMRVGDGVDFLFVRVRRERGAVELSSGLVHKGVRSEAWHGVASGGCLRSPLRLQCALRFDGTTFQLELRVRAGRCGEGETLVYGCGRYQCPTLANRARVDLDGLCAIDRMGAGAIETPPVNGASSPHAAARSTPEPAPRLNGKGSSVRFCESDEWFEYETPIRVIPQDGPGA